MPSVQRFPTLLDPKNKANQGKSETLQLLHPDRHCAAQSLLSPPQRRLPGLRPNDAKEQVVQSKDNLALPPRDRRPTSRSPTPHRPNTRGDGDVANERLSSRARSTKRQVDSAAMHRELSFVRCSVAQIRNAVQSECADIDFDVHFWLWPLSQDVSEDAKFIVGHSLSFWVKVFHRCKEVGRWKSLKELQLQCWELQEVLEFSSSRCQKLVSLWSQNLHEAGKVNMSELMSAGVLLSRAIPTKQKLNFLLGIVDKNCSLSLDEEEFCQFITNVMRGLGAIFGVVSDDLKVLKPVYTQKIAHRLYSRISKLASGKLRALFKGTGNGRDMLSELIQATEDRNEKCFTSHGKGIAGKVKSIVKRRAICVERGENPSACDASTRKQQLSFNTIQEWFLKDFLHDPLALPFALTIERWRDRSLCSELGDADAFDDEFYISHGSAEAMSDYQGDKAGEDLWSREKIILLRDLHDYSRSGGSCSIRHLPDGLGRRVSKMLSRQQWVQIVDALDALSTEASKDTFPSILTKASPKTSDRARRMYLNWCSEYDEIPEIEARLAECETILLKLRRERDLPLLPPDEHHRLSCAFERMDVEGSGKVHPEEIARWLNVEGEGAQSCIMEVDLSDDGLIDKEEFMLLMINPTQYRLPGMHGFERDVFLELLEHHSRKLRAEIRRRKCLFSTDKHHHEPLETPRSMMPEIDEETWNRWVGLFHALSDESSESISVSQLQYSLLIPKPTADFMRSMLESSSKTTILKHDFLAALLEVRSNRCKAFEESVFG